SRKRLTRFPRDWSSDVCSTDLMRVRVRVPKLASPWITALVTRTAGEHACIAFALDRTDAAGRQQFAFLSGVTAIEVDVRGDGAKIGRASCREILLFPWSCGRYS